MWCAPAFPSPPELLLFCGETIEITVHNNSWANETQIQLGPANLKKSGQLTGQYLFPAAFPGRFTLRHYDDTLRRSNGGLGMRLADQLIQYTAPTSHELELGRAKQQIQIKVSAGGTERVLELTVSCCGSGTGSSISPSRTWCPSPPAPSRWVARPASRRGMPMKVHRRM
jgi:hypothetical protein